MSPVDAALAAIRCYATSGLTRNQAAVLIELWSGRWQLTLADVDQVLAEFPVWAVRPR